jgi:hypothetical protein
MLGRIPRVALQNLVAITVAADSALAATEKRSAGLHLTAASAL